MPSLHPEPGRIARTARSLYSTLDPSRGESRTPSTAQVLASLLDLQGSVRLAHCLGARATAGEKRGAAAKEAPLLLVDYVRKRLAAIDEATCRRLAQPFDGARARVPDAAGVREMVEGVAGAELAAGGRALVATLWRAHREYLLSSLARVRFEVASLREELTEDLRALGPAAARLEAIDATLRAATEEGVTRLFDRLVSAMEIAFTRSMTERVAALPATPAERAAAVTSWFDEVGPIGAQLARTGDVTRGLLARDGAVLDALVEEACRG